MSGPIVPLGSITEPKVHQGEPRGSGEFTYIDISSIDNKKKQIVDPKRLLSGEAPNRARQHLHNGDVIVSMTRPNLNAVALIDQQFDGAIASTGFDVLRASGKALPEWIYYAVQSPQFVTAMCGLVQGALYPAVRPKDVRAFGIPLPPLDEQQRIVADCEKHFTRLDVGLFSLERAKTKLKHLRASILKHACEGRLVATEAELARQETRAYETGEDLLNTILKERRGTLEAKRKYKEPLAPVAEEYSSLPEGWAWATVEQLNPPGRPCAYGVLQPGPEVPNGVPIVRVGDIDNGKVDQTNLKRISPAIAARYPRTKLQGDEVAISLVGAIGRTAVIPDSLMGANTARAVGVIPLTKRVISSWVEIWFRNPQKVAEMTAKSHEVARKTLNLEDVRAALVALPPVSEQARIVTEAERRLSIIDDAETIVGLAGRRAATLRSAILHQVFAGASAPVGTSRITMPAISPQVDSTSRTLEPVIMKKPKEKRRLIDVMSETKGDMTPEELFHLAGFTDADVDLFFDELHRLEMESRIAQVRPNDTQVLIRVLDR